MVLPTLQKLKLHVEQHHLNDSQINKKLRCKYCKQYFSYLFSHAIAKHQHIMSKEFAVCIHSQKLFVERNLNYLEKSFFDGLIHKSLLCRPVIFDAEKVISNLNHLYYLHRWKQIVFECKSFVLAGGSLLRCLDKLVYYSSKELSDLDLFSVCSTYEQFEKNLSSIQSQFRKSKYMMVYFKKSRIIHEIYVNFTSNISAVRKDCSISKIIEVIEHEVFWTKMQFIWLGKNVHKNHLLTTIFDIEPCQVCYDGTSISSSYAFIQSVTTGTMLNVQV